MELKRLLFATKIILTGGEELRDVDRKRIAAQLEFINRVTKGGQLDYETAIKERKALAERVGNRRKQFLDWMKKQGFSQDRIAYEMSMFEKLLAELNRDPLKVEYPW